MKAKAVSKGKKKTAVEKRTAVTNIPSIAEIARHFPIPYTNLKGDINEYKFDPTRLPGYTKKLRTKRVTGETTWGYHLYFYMEDDQGGKLGRSGDPEVRYTEIQPNNHKQFKHVQFWPTLGYMETDVKNELTRLGYHEHNEWFGVSVNVINKVVESLQRTAL